jgi:Yip1 domain
MIKVFFLIFEPGATWEKIAQARRGLIYITLVHVLPLIAAGSALETWSLSRPGTPGKWQPQFHMFKVFPANDVYTFEIVQFVLLLAVVFIGALLVFKISQTFQDRLTFLQAFTTVAYGLSPLFLFRLLDASATMYPAIPWLIGLGVTMWILYQGIPRVMHPDPTHAFGVYLSAMIVVTLTSGLARLITGMYLLGYMDFHHSWLSRKLAHFFGQ